MGPMSPIVFAVALATAGPGQVDDFPGDPAAGRLYVEKVCTECHAISGAKGRHGAPSFTDIAATPGMTGTALIAWLTKIPHRNMPDLVLAPAEARDIVAYILSLRRAEDR